MTSEPGKVTHSTARLERARLEIARLGLGDSHELSQALGTACRVSAQALQVERVGVWLLEPDGVTLRRVELYQAGDQDPGSARIAFARQTAYLEALATRRVVQADDALQDPRTVELVVDYLRPLGIGAMLDAPIFRGGRVVGVVCHEHLGGPRTWRARDGDFACSVADMLGGLFEQSARLEAESRLARAARMEALGRLAAGVAHDMNNVLSGVRLAAEVLVRAPASGPDLVQRASQEVIEHVDRGARLTQQLLAFCRGTPTPPGKLDLTALLRELEPGLRSLLGERCALRVQLPPAPCLVRAERSQLEQVVMNLALNARDAIPAARRGTVTLELRVQPRTGGAGREALLSVTDDGEGMDPETRARAFEPFFSTKPAGQGTGMGLAIVYAITQRAGGSVDVVSAPGQGATFQVHLPLLEA